MTTNDDTEALMAAANYLPKFDTVEEERLHRKQRLAAWSTKLLLERSFRARAQAKRLGQSQPSVPLLTRRITRCGAAES